MSLILDNNGTMTRVNISVGSRFKEKKGNIFISGCPCHLPHKIASHTRDSFSNVVWFNVENLSIDFVLIKVLKERELREHFQFCDQEYMSMLTYISIRSLSLPRIQHQQNFKILC